MTDVSRDEPLHTRRAWWKHLLVGLALLSVSLFAAICIVVPWVFAKEQFGCRSFDSEYDTADASVRGRFACGDSNAPDVVALVCLIAVLLLLAAALVVWIRRVHVAVFVLLTTLAAVAPCVTGIVVMALPTTCSDEQAAADPDGCQVDE